MPDTTPAATCEIFFLSFAQDCVPFGLPDYPTVARAAKQHFKQEAINVDEQRYKGDIYYRIELQHPVGKEQYLTFEIGGIDYDIRLEPKAEREKRQRTQRANENGLLLTFKDAGKNFLRDVPCSEFDRILQNDLKLELLKPTQLQRIPETDIYNGNRFAVVKTPEDKTKISDSIPIVHPVTKKHYQIQVRFKGKSWYCSRCMRDHDHACPELQAFYQAKDTRKQLSSCWKINTA